MRGVAHILEYEVEIRRVAGADDLRIRVEIPDGQAFGRIRQAVLDAFRNQLNIRVNVEQAPAGSLPRYEFKARRYKRV
jgi:phenylacetate-CoA ligase